MPGREEVEALRARLVVLEALAAEGQRNRQLLEAIPSLVLRVSLTGVIEYINHVLPGYDDPVGQSIYKFAPPDQHELMRDAVARASETLQPTSYDSLVYTPDGAQEWYLTTLAPILEDGQLAALAMTSANATRIRRAEASLEESRVKMQLALDAGNVGVWRWDMGTDTVEWDDKLDAMFGLTPEQSPRTVAQFMSLIPEDQKAAMAAHIQGALDTGFYSDFELRADRTDGTRWFIIKGGIMRDARGAITGLLGGVIDATERRHTEDRLRQTAKLEAVGQLAAGVAHNFNNMLAVIVPSLELIKRNPHDPDRDLLEDALSSAANAAQLVRQLMVFARSPPTTDQRSEPLSEVVRRAAQLCRQTFTPWITLDIGPLDAARLAEVDAAPMEQAVMNLLLNARDALVPGNERPARIEISAVEIPEVAMRARHAEATGPWVELRIRDTGDGMDSATRARIFEPFFTTKPAGQGTGLGLSTAWATVVAHRGTLECESAPGVGTTFSLLLPIEAIAPAPAAVAPEPAQRGANRAVLIIDDQDAVRRAHAAMLRSAGFSVVAASSGTEAVAVASTTPIDIALLDYSMPGLSAEETLRALRQIRPDLPVVCLSGLAIELEGATAHLVKPVSYDVLVNTLVRAMEPGRA